YTFAVSVGSLPATLTLNSSTGVISGTPTVAGAYSFTVEATDTNGVKGTRGYSGTIADITPSIAPATLPHAIQAQAYSQQLTASGGSSPYTFTLDAGTLPTGLTLSSGGLISGTTSQVGAGNITVRVTDTHSRAGTQAYTLTVA